MRLLVAITALTAALGGCAGAGDNEAPRRIPTGDAFSHLLERVQAQAVDGVYANSVRADVVIDSTGTVESVKVLDGDPRHGASATAALMNYRFSPIAVDGHARRVVTTISISIPDTFSSAELAGAAASGVAAADVRADPEIVVTSDCTRETLINRNAEKAVETCARALAVVNALPADRLEERIKAHSNLGEAYVVARRWPDAIREFETALRLERPLATNSYRGGERLGMIAMSYFNLGDLQAADLYAGKAVATLKAAVPANEDDAWAFRRALRSTLQMQARFKRLHGDEIGANRLERQAEALDIQER